jgi:hypothetical protein
MTHLKTALRGTLLASAVALAAGSAQAQNFVNVLTGGTSGVYYPLGVGLSNIYAENIDKVRTQVQSTKASVENLNLLQDGRGEIGFSLGDSIAAAWAGDAEAGFPQKLDKLRGIAAIYPNYVQLVALSETGASTLNDLAGKAVSVGAPASGTELNARAILGAAGLSYDDLGKTEYLPFAESVELMKNRQLDATLQSAGLGVASIRDLSTSVEITVVEIPASIAETLGAPYQPATIPAGTYEGQEADVATVAISNYLVTHSEVSDELAYQMTKQLFENLEALTSSHQAAAQITLEGALDGMPIPLHPGAERFYREQGLID